MTGLQQTILALIFGVFLGISFGLGLDLVSSFIPDIKREIGFDYATAGRLTALGKIGLMAGGLTCAIAAARIGNGRLVVFSVLITGAALLMLGLASHLWMVALAMFMAGFSSASSWVPMVGVFSEHIDEANMGKAFGVIVGAGAGGGTLATGALAPVFSSHFDWRFAMLSMGTATLMFACVSSLFLWRRGILAAGQTLRAQPSTGMPEPAKWYRAVSEVMSADVVLIWGILFLVGFTMQPFQNYLSAYIRDELHYSIEIASTSWIAMGMTGLGAGVLMGAASDRYGVRNMMMLALSLLIVANMLLIFPASEIHFIGAGIAFGLCFYSVPGMIPSYIGNIHKPDIATRIFAIGNIILGLGAMTGNLLGGSTKAAFGTFTIYYGASVGAVVIMIGLTWMVIGKHRPGTFKHARSRPYDAT